MGRRLSDWVKDYERMEQKMGRHTSDTSGGDFKQPPEGTHVARCVKLIDLGTQHGEYEGKPTARNQVLIQWELPNELMEDGKPFVVSRFYTNTLSERGKLRPDLESWRGRAFTATELMDFDLENILGKPCMVTIVHNDKGRARVTGVAGMPKGTICPQQVNPSFTFWIEEWNDAKFQSISEGIRTMITNSDEFKEMMGRKTAPLAKLTAPLTDDDFDSIPF